MSKKLEILHENEVDLLIDAIVREYDRQLCAFCEQICRERAVESEEGEEGPKRKKSNANSAVVLPPRVLVAVAGRPGSGKTTAAAVIAERVRCRMKHYRLQACVPPQPCGPRSLEGLGEGVKVQVMPMDGYHLYKRELQAMPDPKHAFERRGAEWTFNPTRLAEDLTAIKCHSIRVNKTIDMEDGKRKVISIAVRPVVRVPSFDHGKGDPTERDLSIDSDTGVVIVEGNYLLYRDKPEWAAVSRLFDLRVFFSCPREVCLERLIRRHCKAWGISREEAAVRAGGSDTKNGDLVDTTRANAHFILHSVEVDNPSAKL